MQCYKELKVLHVALTDSGGAGRGMLNLHRALLDIGIDSKVLVAIKHSKADFVYSVKPNRNIWHHSPCIYFLERVFRKCGICFNPYDRIIRRIYKKAATHPAVFSSPITQYDIANHPLVLQADIINLHFISGFVDIGSFFRSVNKPIVWTIRDENPGLGGFHYRVTRDRLYSYYSDLEDTFLKIKRQAIGEYKNLHLVSLSKLMASFCQSVDFLAVHPNRIIYNPLDARSYSLTDKAKAKEQLGFHVDDILISFVACNLDEKRKGLKQVVDALKLLEDKRIKLLCIGHSTTRMDVPNVFFGGTITDTQKMSLVYAASNVFVAPSSQESFGKTIVEALYCGTPVVCTPVGIAPEIINRSNGLLCKTGGAVDVADAIREVLRRKYDGEKIRKEALGRFSSGLIAKQYFDLYSNILKKCTTYL